MLYIANVHLPSDRCVVFIIDLFVFILAISGKVKLRLLFLKKALHIEVSDDLFACLLLEGFTIHLVMRLEHVRSLKWDVPPW